MRGIGTVLFEPVAEVFVQQMPAGTGIDAQAFADRMLTSVLVYAPLIVLAVGVLSAVVYYLRRESRPRRVR